MIRPQHSHTFCLALLTAQRQTRRAAELPACQCWKKRALQLGTELASSPLPSSLHIMKCFELGLRCSRERIQLPPLHGSNSYEQATRDTGSRGTPAHLLFTVQQICERLPLLFIGALAFNVELQSAVICR